MAHIQLNWIDNSTTEECQKIYRSTSPIDPANLPAPLVAVAKNVTSYTDADIEPGTTYYYRVSSYTAGYVAVSDEIVVTSGGVKPVAPTEIGQSFGGGIYIGDVTIDAGGASDGDYHIIMGKLESERILQWRTNNATASGTDSLVDGMANTLAMQTASPDLYPAGMYCLNYAGGGFHDWYMPAFNELFLAWNNRSQIIGMDMSRSTYISSTQRNVSYCRGVNFINGDTSENTQKASSSFVRPVRRIKIT